MNTKEYITSIISSQGPISMAQYMSIVLSDPMHGYYMKKQPIGKMGDFITAPEISQMFGEMIGIWCVDAWKKMGSPTPWHLVELGPGLGTLMMDLLRGTSHIGDFSKGLTVHLVEMSPTLKEAQEKQLAPYNDISIMWHETIDDLPTDAPMLVIANEFFDALPVHSFQKTAEGWREHMIAQDEKGELCVTLSPEQTINSALIPENYKRHEVDSVVEVCPAGAAIMEKLSTRIGTQGGAMLAIDYGYDRPPLTPTIQTVKNHEHSKLLDDPGKSDVTAHVDFSQLDKAARQHEKIYTFPLVDQGVFLHSCGIEIRKNMLLEHANDAQKEMLTTGYERLTSADGMGTLFLCLILSHANVEPLIGCPA